MKSLNTINGVICREEVRLICPHEHLFLDMTHEAIEPVKEEDKLLFYGDITMKTLGALRRNPYIVRKNLILDDVDICAEELSFLEKQECDLLIDVTSVGLGRDIEKLRQISERTSIRIAVGCGFFVQETIGRIASLSVDEIADEILDEIENGIGDTGIKPGVIGEVGTSEIIYETERKSLLAAAKAHRKSGLPIYLLTYPWSRAGLEAIELLIAEGVLPGQICICHLDVSFDREYLLQVLEKGVYVEFDNFGKEFYLERQPGAFSGGPFETDVDRVRMLKELVEKGYTRQLLLANDLCLKASLHAYGGWGYDHVFANIVPMMRQEGIASEAVHTIVEENPKAFIFQ